LRIQLLGDFSVLFGGEPLAGLNTPRLQSFLAYLLLHRGAPQSRAHLAFLFWPDLTEDQARTNLRKLIYHLRCTLPKIVHRSPMNVDALFAHVKRVITKLHQDHR
jgi:DNA-binding SARP family transcriptional activator